MQLPRNFPFINEHVPPQICPTAIDCNPALTDPCNPAELTRRSNHESMTESDVRLLSHCECLCRCGCDTRVDEVFPMVVLGFNLQPEEQLCSLNAV